MTLSQITNTCLGYEVQHEMKKIIIINIILFVGGVIILPSCSNGPPVCQVCGKKAVNSGAKDGKTVYTCSNKHIFYAE